MTRPAPHDGGGAADKRGPAVRYLIAHACAFGVAVVIALLVDLIAGRPSDLANPFTCTRFARREVASQTRGR